MATPSQPPPREWRKPTTDGLAFLVSTDPSKLDLEFINSAFASEEMYWAKPLPLETLQLMLANSLTLGVYQINPDTTPSDIPPPPSISEPSSPRTPSPTLQNPSNPPIANSEGEYHQVGLARLITDHVSTCYLTDVYIAPHSRQHGLGKWVVACCKEIIESMPALRRAFLVASRGVGEEFYKRELGFWDVAEEAERLAVMTRRGFQMPKLEGGREEGERI